MFEDGVCGVRGCGGVLLRVVGVGFVCERE